MKQLLALAALLAACIAPVQAAEGTIKKVDKAAGTVTIAHGPIDNLKMPGMTMAFKLQDAKGLDVLKPGDKIVFDVIEGPGGLVVTRWQPAGTKK